LDFASGCSVVYLEDLQNHTSILDNHSTILRPEGSIISIGERNLLSGPDPASWTFLQGKSSGLRGPEIYRTDTQQDEVKRVRDQRKLIEPGGYT